MRFVSSSHFLVLVPLNRLNVSVLFFQIGKIDSDVNFFLMCSFQGTSELFRILLIIQSSAADSCHRIAIQTKKPPANTSASSFSFDNSMLLELSNGDKEIRTPDPLLARQVLSQLSYTPIVTDYATWKWA